MEKEKHAHFRWNQNRRYVRRVEEGIREQNQLSTCEVIGEGEVQRNQKRRDQKGEGKSRDGKQKEKGGSILGKEGRRAGRERR